MFGIILKVEINGSSLLVNLVIELIIVNVLLDVIQDPGARAPKPLKSVDVSIVLCCVPSLLQSVHWSWHMISFSCISLISAWTYRLSFLCTEPVSPLFVLFTVYHYSHCVPSNWLLRYLISYSFLCAEP